jgi:hypothetical protein
MASLGKSMPDCGQAGVTTKTPKVSKLPFGVLVVTPLRFARTLSLVSEPSVRFELTTYSLQVVQLGPTPTSPLPTEHRLYGAICQIRTDDLLITSELLYRLS